MKLILVLIMFCGMASLLLGVFSEDADKARSYAFAAAMFSFVAAMAKIN